MEMKKISIYEAMNNINKKYYIPAFQRGYVWKYDQIEKLFSSIMDDYPISTMLFWEIKQNESGNLCEFYEFLKEFKKENDDIKCPSNINTLQDITAVIDGQQRLTSLYLALCSDKYVISKKHNFLYLRLSEQGDEKYVFKWYPQDTEIYLDEENIKWFKCKNIFGYRLAENSKFNKDKAKEQGLNEDEREILKEFYDKIITEKSILNYFEVEGKSLDRAVDIFTRINSGGRNLNFSDIAFSFILANWGDDNFKQDYKDINAELKTNESLKNAGFKLEKNFLFKSMLFVFDKELRFKLDAFSKDFIENTIKPNWDRLKKCYIDVFTMLWIDMRIGNEILGGMNVLLPIIYFAYHNGLKSVSNKEIIKRWLLKAILNQATTTHSDQKLVKMRDVLQVSKNKEFPAQQIEDTYEYKLNKKSIKNLLNKEYNSADSWRILYMLYPNLDTTREFHQDHIHPKSVCIKNKIDKKLYNSIGNLELLYSLENIKKNDEPFAKWIENGDHVKKIGKKEFFRLNYIPENINLELDNFNEFYNKRIELLEQALYKLLDVDLSESANQNDLDDE